MANPEHLEILEQGVEVWNKWRFANRSVKPDLSHVELISAILNNANLRSSNFSFADLRASTLTRALLNGANFNGADLSGAILHSANLSGASFIGANFGGAQLQYANLKATKLAGADFLEVRMANTDIGDTDLSQVKNLESIQHKGPSTVGIDTIYKSGGKIPEAFLRGCGVPDEFITYMRSLVVHPIQFYSCFISYSSEDQDFANRLYADLQNKGVRCWFAPEDLKIGDKIRDRIDESIRLRDKLLLILSKQSIASDWVEHEVESALEEERLTGRTILFPIRLDDVVMESNRAWAALIRRTRHIGDFTYWKEHDSYQKAFDRLLRDLKTEAESSKASKKQGGK